jgi:hypothetical protein
MATGLRWRLITGAAGIAAASILAGLSEPGHSNPPPKRCRLTSMLLAGS